MRTSEIVAEGRGQIVKTIGDEAMFVTEDAGDACRIALELIDAAGDTLPPVRVGLATGEMASVFGDLYGPDVNLAARLVGAAGPRRPWSPNRCELQLRAGSTSPHCGRSR